MQARLAKQRIREEAAQRQAEQSRMRDEFAKQAEAERKIREAARLEAERIASAIRERRNAEMDQTLRRVDEARRQQAEAKSKSPSRSHPISPLTFSPPAQPSPDQVCPAALSCSFYLFLIPCTLS